MAQPIPAPAVYPDFSSFVASADRLSNAIGNLTEKIPNFIDVLNRTSNKIPEITSASNRMSDVLENITLQVPNIIDEIDKTNNNVEQFTNSINSVDKSINNIMNTVLTPGYIIGTTAGIVAVSLAFAATFVGGRYAVNRYCIDQKQLLPEGEDVPVIVTNDLPGSPS